MPTKVFVNSNLTANFTCVECGVVNQKDVSKYIKHDKVVKLKYRCPSCKHSFSTLLERRRSIRKIVNLTGCLKKNSKKYSIIVEDISKHGFGITIVEKVSIKIGEQIEIEFNLDDTPKSIIQRVVLVKKIFLHNKIGCEFPSSEHTGNLGKYFLFNY